MASSSSCLRNVSRRLLRLPQSTHLSAAGQPRSLLVSPPLITPLPPPPPPSSLPPSPSLHSLPSTSSTPLLLSSSSPRPSIPASWTLPQSASLSQQPCGSTGSKQASDSSPDSDEDFKPQYKKPEDIPPIHKMIQEDIQQNPVMVYMKGVPAAPMCGFSNGVVQLLQAYGVTFKSRNVLEDPELRQGVKTFSQWPTIPQVFVNGEFVGGCDILFKMHESGELESLFASVKQPGT